MRGCNFTQFVEASRTYNKETQGCDMWSRTELLLLPKVALSAIVTALNESMANLVWPHQQLLSLNPCLGKPGGGIRTICKTPMTYRTALRTNRSVSQWEKDNKQVYDTATKVSSAFTAALVRNVRAEVAARLGLKSVTIFYDYHKFFDTLDIERLVEQGIKCEFPITELVLCLSQHLSPRVIQVSGCSSESMSVFRSILAGCIFNKALTAVYLQKHVQQLDKDHREAHLGTFCR